MKTPYLPTLAPTAVLPLVFEQELAPLPGTFTRFVCLANKGQTLQGELCCIGETNAPTAYPSSMRLL